MSDMTIGKGNDARTEWGRIQGIPFHTGTTAWGFVWVADNNPSTALDYILAANSPFPNPFITLPFKISEFNLSCIQNGEWLLRLNLAEIVNAKSLKLAMFDEDENESKAIFIDLNNDFYSEYYFEDWIYTSSNLSFVQLWEISTDDYQSLISEIKAPSCAPTKTVINVVNPSVIGTPLEINHNSELLTNNAKVLITDAQGRRVEDALVTHSKNKITVESKSLNTSGLYFLNLNFSEKDSHIIKVIRN